MALVRYSSLYGPEGERGLITPPAGGGTMRCSYGAFEIASADASGDWIILCPLPTRAIILDVFIRAGANISGATKTRLSLRDREIDGGAERYANFNSDLAEGAREVSAAGKLGIRSDFFNPFTSHMGEQLWQYPTGGAALDVDPVEIWNLCLYLANTPTANGALGFQLYWSDGS